MIFVVAQKLSGIAAADLGEGPVRPATSYFEPKLRPEGPKKKKTECVTKWNNVKYWLQQHA